MHIKSFITLMSLLLLFSQPFSAFAISIFQWIDSAGVTHFSEETPADGIVVKQLSHYVIDENYPQGQKPEEDYYSIINQWKRTNDERESRVKLEQENKQARQIAQRQTQAQPISNYEPPQRYYTGLSPSPYLYNRGRVHHRNNFPYSPGKRAMEPTSSVPVPGYVGNVGVGGFGSN